MKLFKLIYEKITKWSLNNFIAIKGILIWIFK